MTHNPPVNQRTGPTTSAPPLSREADPNLQWRPPVRPAFDTPLGAHPTTRPFGMRPEFASRTYPGGQPPPVGSYYYTTPQYPYPLPFYPFTCGTYLYTYPSSQYTYATPMGYPSPEGDPRTYIPAAPGHFTTRPLMNQNPPNNTFPTDQAVENPRQGPVERDIPIHNLDTEFEEVRTREDREGSDPNGSQERSSRLFLDYRAETGESQERQSPKRGLSRGRCNGRYGNARGGRSRGNGGRGGSGSSSPSNDTVTERNLRTPSRSKGPDPL